MREDIIKADDKINEKDDGIFPEIINDLKEIISYTKANLIKKEAKSNLINLEEEEDDDFSLEMSEIKKRAKDFQIKLGKKRKQSESIENSEDDESELNKIFDENNEMIKEKEKINKNIQEIKFKLKEKIYKSYGIEIVQKIEAIIIKINSIKNKENQKNYSLFENYKK